MVEVQGLTKLLRAVADRMEGNVDGLSKELLVQSAERIELLEKVAECAASINAEVPLRGEGALKSLVSRCFLIELSAALQAANPHLVYPQVRS